jgi:CBS domain containing-hemolysin-like protein
LLKSNRFPFLNRYFGKAKADATEAEEYEQELIDSVEEFSETITREVMIPHRNRFC